MLHHGPIRATRRRAFARGRAELWMSETRNARGAVEKLLKPCRLALVRARHRAGRRARRSPSSPGGLGRASGMSGFCPRMSTNVHECLRFIPPPPAHVDGCLQMLTNVDVSHPFLRHIADAASLSAASEAPAPPRAQHAKSQEMPRSTLALALAGHGFPWLLGPEEAKQSQPKPRKAKGRALHDKAALGARLRRPVIPVVPASAHGLDSAPGVRRGDCRA